jgi:mRNA interferase MazF
MKRGEIWMIDLEPPKGSEIKNRRPAVVVNRDSVGILPLKIIVPITRWQDRYEKASWMIRIEPDKVNGLDMVSSADTFQVRSVSQERLLSRIGMVSNPIMKQIEQALKIVLNLT